MTPGEGVLRLGREPLEISITDAKTVIAGYCFAEEAGSWDTRRESVNKSATTLPDVSWRRWAYRAYDCEPPSPGSDLTIADLLMPVALNVTQGYGSALLERLQGAAPLVSHAMRSVPDGAAFWQLEESELREANQDKDSIASSLNRAWAVLMSVPGCAVTVTHKILHHKWPKLFPLIDTLTLKHLPAESQWLAIHTDLSRHEPEFEELEEWFAPLAETHGGRPLFRLRLHDILLWCDAAHQTKSAREAGKEFV